METELLAPAGDFETARAAFAAGADAVYCGLGDFSARAFATNFSLEDLSDLIRLAHASNKRVYVTFNTVIDESRLDEAIERLSRLEEVGPDAIIVQDLGVARICRRFFPGLVLHASTQLVAHNLEGVLALKEIGFTRVVLARELSLAEITQISKRCGDVELEVFIHGALCYSVSGLCLYGAMEKGRSGNRGCCPYLCRQCVEGKYPFSMRDLRLGEDVKKLVDAGVASLKIEGRMKSPLYVASVTKWYRQFLDGTRGILAADLETVFSRRTTELRLNGENAEVIDPDSLGHIGAEIGTVKRITKDREGRKWLRFHTMRALEKHDGLQFAALTDEGRHFGFGISEMRLAISRTPVFEVAAGADVEILLPEDDKECPVRSGDTVFCSMSNAVKRAFPVPSFRKSDYPGTKAVDFEVRIDEDRISGKAKFGEITAEAEIRGTFAAAKSPEKTFASVEKALSKLGDTDYRIGRLTLDDAGRRYAPMSVLNDLRRDLVERLDSVRENARLEKVDKAELAADAPRSAADVPRKTIKLRIDQKLPAGDWDEVVMMLPSVEPPSADYRYALPVWNGELEFNKLRNRVKAYLRVGCRKWECSDLATLRMLKELGVEDITADWTLYTFNSRALELLSELGVKRFVASPENNADNLAYLAESGYAVEFLVQQSTPLFISLHRPAAEVKEPIVVSERDGLFITTRNVPRTFSAPNGASTRIDLCWDPA